MSGNGIPIQHVMMHTYDVMVGYVIRINAPNEQVAKNLAKSLVNVSGAALDAIQGAVISAEEKMFGAEKAGKGPRNPVRFPEITKDSPDGPKLSAPE